MMKQNKLLPLLLTLVMALGSSMVGNGASTKKAPIPSREEAEALVRQTWLAIPEMVADDYSGFDSDFKYKLQQNDELSKLPNPVDYFDGFFNLMDFYPCENGTVEDVKIKTRSAHFIEADLTYNCGGTTSQHFIQLVKNWDDDSLGDGWFVNCIDTALTDVVQNIAKWQQRFIDKYVVGETEEVSIYNIYTTFDYAEDTPQNVIDYLDSHGDYVSSFEWSLEVVPFDEPFYDANDSYLDPTKRKKSSSKKTATNYPGPYRYPIYVEVAQPIMATEIMIVDREPVNNELLTVEEHERRNPVAGIVTQQGSDDVEKFYATQEKVKMVESRPAPPAPKIEEKKPEPKPEQIFTAVEQQAAFPGGQAALMKWLSSNLIYPETAKQNEISGRVIVRMVVNADGSIEQPVVVKGVDKDLDAEAIRLVKMMPNWQPGKDNGVPVRSYFTLPVIFKLESKSEEASPNN